jgi:hypothetical protein
MNIPGITWRGDKIDDSEILRGLPLALARILSEVNGFILHEGALHLRGASLEPAWHSIRAAWRGPQAFCNLYDNILPSDVPFAQDQIGDQFLIRDDRVIRLFAETGEIEALTASIDDFFSRLTEDIEKFLNVGLSHTIQPGQLLLAYPPFVCRESESGVSLKPVRADEVILFHADLARQIRNVPDGGQIRFKVTE